MRGVIGASVVEKKIVKLFFDSFSSTRRGVLCITLDLITLVLRNAVFVMEVLTYLAGLPQELKSQLFGLAPTCKAIFRYLNLRIF